MQILDIESDRLVPFDTARLREAVRLLDALGIPGRPGCPTDAPPELQPVVQYWVSAVHSRHGRQPVDPKTLRALPYVTAMAQALGKPIRSLPAYVSSPLTAGGESWRCALAYASQLEAITVSSMPSMGGTAPIALGDALALGAAEVIGAAMLIQSLTPTPVRWSVEVFAADMGSLMLVFGSPEAALLEMASAEADAFLHGRPYQPYASNLHCNAKRPGAQACAERASLMTAGAMLGARSFVGGGALALDDIFSPEQLLYDMEILAHVQRLVSGLSAGCDPARCVAETRAALVDGTYAGLEHTAASYRETYWQPHLFSRDGLARWQGRGAPELRTLARGRVRELLAQPAYELEGDERRELDSILERARQALS